MVLFAAAFLMSAVPTAHATCGTDTVVVYGPTQFTGSGVTIWHIVDDEFSTTTSWGRRYLVEVVNGDTRVNELVVSVDGQQCIGSSECGTGVSSITRIIDVADGSQTHFMTVAVKGTTSSYVTLRISHVSESSFTIYGPTTFTWSSVPATQSFGFTPPAGAKAPAGLRVINGDGDGFSRITNGFIKVNGGKTVSSFGTGIAIISREVTLLSGGQRDSVIMSNSAPAGSFMSLQFTATDSTAPALAVTTPVEGFLTEASQVSVAGSVTDETPVTVTINGGTPIQTSSTFSQNFSMPADGNYTISTVARNSACLADTVVRHVARDNLPPALTVSRPGFTFAPVDSDSIAIGGSWADTIMTVVTLDGDTIATGRYGSFSVPKYALDLGPNRLVFRGVDALGHTTTITRYVFRTTVGEPAPLDSVLHPPSLSTTEITPFLEGVRFLYAGDTEGDTLQKAVIADSIKPELAAVVRGRVTARDYGALANVKVRVLGHGEYGYALTRSDGRFDMVVNGGGALTLRFTKSGFLESQRVVQPPVGGYAVEDNVALIGRSNKVHWLPFDSVRVVQGRFATDANGDRKLRLVFQSGTVAKIARTAGDTASLGGIHLYLTEYTVGGDGPRAMPGALPPASAYTYAVDFSVDEADSIGKILHPDLPAPDVLFTKPVVCYLPNFLHLPVGVAVPYGYYDRRAGQWVAEPDGWVIRILTNNDTTVTIDSKGNGAPDGQARLDSLGITTAELQRLAGYYAAGDTIWREVATRFSNCDFNLPAGFMSGLGLPAMGGPPHTKPPDPCAPSTNGSIINCEDRILGERVALTGTPLTLNYQSFRAAGDAVIRSVVVPVLVDPLVIGGWTLAKAIVRLEVAGKVYEQIVDNPTVSTPPVTLTWDGNDVYDRRLPGSVLARVSLGYGFRTTYGMGNGSRSLGVPGATSGTIGEPVGDRQIDRIIWNRQSVFLGVPDARSAGLGGWTLSPHHHYDPNGAGNVYLGDGSVIRGDLLPSSVRRVSCLGSCPSPTRLDQMAVDPTALAFASDGRLYFAHDDDKSVYRVNADGSSLTRVAGNGTQGAYAGDGLATATPLPHTITSLAVAPDGSLYLSSSSNASRSTTLIAVVTPNGQIRKVIGGDGTHDYGRGDGLPVSQAYVGYVRSLAVGPDGTLYIQDGGWSDLHGSSTDSVHVRHIETSGIITNYAGRGGALGNSDSTGIATKLPINYTRVIAADDAGNVYLITPLNVRRVATDGTILTLMGKPPGASEILTGMVSREGAVYLATSGAGFWRRDADGSLRRIGGEGSGVPSSPTPVPFPSVSPSIWPDDIAIAPDGNGVPPVLRTSDYDRFSGVRPCPASC